MVIRYKHNLLVIGSLPIWQFPRLLTRMLDEMDLPIIGEAP
jgi:hypothetical protein